MTVKEYLEGKVLTAVDTVDSIILNLITIGEVEQSLEVDTFDIPAFTPLVRTENFVLTDTKLEANGIIININTTNVQEWIN